MASENIHIPVLVNAVIECLNVREGGTYIDATLGAGGHALQIAAHIGIRGRVVGIERDAELFEITRKRLDQSAYAHRFVLVNDSYTNIVSIAHRLNLRQVDGILFDFGLSSWHLEKSGRGFSFQKEEPLGMNYDKSPDVQRTAGGIVNSYSERQLEEILKNYGEERFARIIAKAIVQNRKRERITTTDSLKRIIEESVPSWYARRRVHPATKTFQALRIAVNGELDNIRTALPHALSLLREGGRMVVIAFHGLEDRILKHLFRQWENEGRTQLLTKKPIVPGIEEKVQNPRSRSAKLRALTKLEKTRKEFDVY